MASVRGRVEAGAWPDPRMLKARGHARGTGLGSPVLLAIDQGTTGTTCLVVDEELQTRGRGYAELPQHFPRPGWVEHDPEEIWQSVLDGRGALAMRRGRRHSRRSGSRTSARRRSSGIADRRAGRDTRSSGRTGARPTRCAELPAELIRERTGLVPDPYFSATKLEWLLARARRRGRPRLRHDRHVAALEADRRPRARDGRHERLAHAALLARRRSTGTTSCSTLFGVRRELLPEIKPVGRVFGEGELLGRDAPGRGHRRRPAGRAVRALPAGAKATYGTGSFVLVETDGAAPAPKACCAPRPRGSSDEEPRHALEGAVFVDGRGDPVAPRRARPDRDAAESEALAASLDDNGGVYFVPALAGPRLAALARRRARRDHRADRAGRRARISSAPRSRRPRSRRGRARRDADELDVLRADGGMTATAG